MLDRLRGLPRPVLIHNTLLCLAVALVALLTLPRLFQSLHDPLTLGTVAAFIVLAFLAESAHVGVGAVSITVTSTVWIAASLLLPFPLPFLIALCALILRYTWPNRFSLHARIFNVASTTLSVTVCSAVATQLGPFIHSLTGIALLYALPRLLVIVAAYYLVEQGKLAMALALLDHRSMWNVIRTDILSTVTLDIGIAASGILLAAVWLQHPLYVLFFVLPFLAVHRALRMLKMEVNVRAAQRHVSYLRDAALMTARLRLQDAAETEVFSPFLSAAQTISGARSVGLYLLSGSPDLYCAAALGGHSLPATMDVPARGGVSESISHGGYMATVGLLSDEGQQPRGALRLVGMPRVLEDEEQDSLGLLGLLIEAALENTARYQERAQQAMTDGLTGLGNRGAFDERLSLEAARAQGAGGQPLGLLCIDLDHFKGINDAYGHEAGDTVLVAVAQTLMATVRGTDLACRPGGDEFAVILPRTSEEEAREVAQRACVALNGLVVMHEGVGIRVGASVGIAVLPEHARTGEGLYRAADRAAYNAKKAGRGCVSDPAGILAFQIGATAAAH